MKLTLENLLNDSAFCILMELISRRFLVIYKYYKQHTDIVHYLTNSDWITKSKQSRSSET